MEWSEVIATVQNVTEPVAGTITHDSPMAPSASQLEAATVPVDSSSPATVPEPAVSAPAVAVTVPGTVPRTVPPATPTAAQPPAQQGVASSTAARTAAKNVVPVAPQAEASHGLIKETVLPGSSGEPAMNGAAVESADADPFSQRLV